MGRNLDVLSHSLPHTAGRLQVPLTDISLMTIFIVAGIGVDDIIVVVDCLDRQPVGPPISQRVSRALGEAGPAILLTSLTNLVAFVVAASVDLPSVCHHNAPARGLRPW